MSKDKERLERYVCGECNPGLPPCKLEIATEYTNAPDQCVFKVKTNGQAKWVLVAYKRVIFDWNDGVEEELTDWIEVLP